MPTKKELVKLGEFYLYLLIFGSFCFLMIKPLNPAILAMDNNLIEVAKSNIQSIIVNPYIKQILMFVLLLYTTFVAIESLVVIRNCVGRLYYKNRGTNIAK